MDIFKRILFFIYNLVFIVLAGAAVALALGQDKPLTYIDLAVATPQNRIILGLVAVVILIIAVMMLVTGFKVESQPTSIVVNKALSGDVSISISAIKVIIMKAVRKVEGIREVEPTVSNGPAGVKVHLHVAINPDHPVPETTESIQNVVRKHLEEIGGLSVAEVKVLVDDFNEGSRAPGIRGA